MLRSFSHTMLFIFLCAVQFPELAQAQSMSEITSSQQPPPPPTGISVKIDKQNHVVIKWSNKTVPAVVSYRLYRADKLAPDNVAVIANIPRNPSSPTAEYTDTTAQLGHAYIYFLTNRDQFGLQSTNSLMAPVNLQVPAAASAR